MRGGFPTSMCSLLRAESKGRWGSGWYSAPSIISNSGAGPVLREGWLSLNETH